MTPHLPPPGVARLARSRSLGALSLVLVALPLTAPPARGQVVVVGDLVREVPLTPGGESSEVIRVRNTSELPSIVRVRTADYHALADGTTTFPAPGTLPRSNAGWMTVRPSRIELAPGEEGEILIDLSPPGDVPSGSHWSVLLIEDEPPVPPPAEGEEAALRLATRVRYAVQIITELPGGGPPAPALAGIQASRSEDGVSLAIDLLNEGDIGFRPRLALHLFDDHGHPQGTHNEDRGLLLPGFGVRVNFELGPLPTGRYEAFLTIDTGGLELVGSQFPFDVDGSENPEEGGRRHDPPVLEAVAAVRVIRGGEPVATPQEGAPLVVPIVLVNEGARDAALSLQASLPPGARVVGLADPVRVPAGGRVLRVLSILLDPALVAGEYRVDVWGLTPPPLGGDSLAVRIPARAPFPDAPPPSSPAPERTARGPPAMGEIRPIPRHRLPVQLRLSGAATGSGPPPIRMVGTGPLREGEGAPLLDFLFQGPGGPLFVSERDAYRARLDLPQGSLEVGDHPFSLSSLGADGQERLGIGGTLRRGRWALEGYAARDRRGSDAPPQAEVRVGAAFAGSTRGAVGARWTGSEVALTLLGRAQPFEGVRADAEAAVAPGDATAQAAFRIAGGVDRGPFRGHAQLRRVPASLPGVGGASTQFGAEGSVRSTHGMSLSGYLRETAFQPLARFTVPGISSQGWVGTFAGLSLTLPRAGTLEAREQEWRGARGMEGNRGDRRIRELRLRTTLRGAGWSLSPSLQVGETRRESGAHGGSSTEPGPKGSTTPLDRIGVSGRIAARGLPQLTGGVEYQRGGVYGADPSAEGVQLRLGGTGLLRGGVTWGMDGSWTHGVNRGSQPPRARALHGWLRVRSPSGTEGGISVQTLAQGTGTVPLPPGGSLSRASTDTRIVLDFMRPFHIPLGQSRSAGGVRLTLIDVSTGAPIAGVPVRVGEERGRSDPRGRLHLQAVPPGEQRLRIESEGWIPAAGVPPSIRVPGGRDAFAQIPLTRPAALRITVRTARADPPPPSDRAPSHGHEGGEPLAERTVRAVGPDDTRIGVTDAAGELRLDGLRPGLWEVTLEGRLPPWHHVEGLSGPVRIGPGEEQKVEVWITPTPRPLRTIPVRRRARSRISPEQEGPRAPRPGAPTTLAPPPMICPLCLGTEITELPPVVGRPFHSCEAADGCGLVFVPKSAHLTPAAEVERYRTHQNDPEDPRYRAFLNRVAQPLAEHLPQGARGLDFGSGPGPTLSKMLTARGFPTVDYDPFFAPDAELLTRRYDFVTCTETAEHFADPRSEFQRLSQLIRAGGWLALMTEPAPVGRPLVSWSYARDETHVSIFRERTFAWLAGWLGWSLLRPEPRVALYRTPLAL